MSATTLNIDSCTLEAAWWGPEKGLTLVLLHEGLGCVALWRDTPRRLADATGLRVFAYSRAGYGQSDTTPLPRPLDYMTREALDVLPRVLDAAGIDDCVLVGHSDGASIAAINAGGMQDFRVHGIVLIAPHFFTEPAGLAEIARAKVAYETNELRNRMSRYHRDVDAAFRGWNGAWLDPRFPTTFDLVEHIAYIRVPILAIQGAADPYGTPAQVDIIAREAYCPVETRVLPGVGHAPHLEAPDTVLPLIAAFVQRVAAIDRLGRPAGRPT
ncbi:MAG TPA: alpha/beta hydrolase [Acidisphaera sp.]|nr:alpha/beta hydrolase [Acidisphaera sp.]